MTIYTSTSNNDILTGTADDDTYVIHHTGVTISDSAGIDTVETSLSQYTLPGQMFPAPMFPSAIENLTFIGAGDFTGTGNGLDNIITGGSGNDTLEGGMGADRLIGAEGDDRLIANSTALPPGDDGSDTLEGGVGNDTYVVSGNDQIVESPGAGIDTVELTSVYVDPAPPPIPGSPLAFARYELGENLENLTLTGLPYSGCGTRRQ